MLIIILIKLYLQEIKYHIKQLLLFLNIITIYNIPYKATRLNKNIINNNSKIVGIWLNLRNDELILTSDNRSYIKSLTKKYFKDNVNIKYSKDFILSPKVTRKRKIFEFINFIDKRN